MEITLEQHLTSCGRYNDRMSSSECTQEVKDNAKQLLDKVNPLLTELGIDTIDITSGFRTSEANGTTSNAAKKSLHMIGKAIDILDNSSQDLGNLILSKPELLAKYGLWMESLEATQGTNTNWVHLDIGQRTDRSLRVFIP